MSHAGYRPLPALIPEQRGTRRAMVAVARSQLRYREGLGNDTVYGAWYGLNRAPWCAIFISWCALRAGCSKIIPRHAYTPAGADWFKARGRWHSTPQRGDLHYVHHASMGRISHVELVVRVREDGTFVVIGGNTSTTGSRQGDGVYRLVRRSVTPGSGFGRPNYRPWTPVG